jgi:TonB family protein
MRKKMGKILMLIPVIVFFSCNKNKEPEIIDITEKDSYMSQQALTPELKGGFKYGSPEWKEVAGLLEKQSGREPERFNKQGFTFRSVIYFSETGNIDKIVLLESINKDIDNAVLNFIRKTFQAVPPEINSKPIKSHIDFVFNYSNEGLSFFPRVDNFLLPDEAPEDQFLASADEMPSPVGGIEDIGKRMKYPEEAKKQGIEGKVLVKLLIDEFGNPQESKIVKSVHPLLDAEARDVLMKTKFTPGKQNGKAVKVQVIVPINFRLK